MNQKLVAFSIAVMVSFMASAVGVLFAFGPSFPERTTAPPLESEFETGYWDLVDAYTAPLDIRNQSTTSILFDYQGESIALVEWHFDFLSESFRGRQVRINSIVLTRTNISEPRPAVLFLHGYGETYSMHIQTLRRIASEDTVVMAIDQPGSGNSTGYPSLGPRTFLNVSTGPQDASLYHSVWAAARAVTVLESLPEVDTSATSVAGVSMGGLVTFILSSIDSRVDGAVPMMSGGNFRNSITSGSLLNSVIEPSYAIGSDELDNIVKWFDPMGYIPSLTTPVLMMFGTDDQFFPLISLMDTVGAIESILTLNIVPNWGHIYHSSWTLEINKWISETFIHETSPFVDVSYSEQASLLGGGIHVTANASTDGTALVCWRSSEPGSVWELALMSSTPEPNGLYSRWVLPLAPGRTLFFVLVVEDDGTRFSSSICQGTAGSILFPLGMLLSTLGIIVIVKKGVWRPDPIVFIREIPYLIGVVMIFLGMILPFLSISGRASLSLLGFLEIYGDSFLLGGWFLPAIMLGICLVLSLSAFRQSFQFRFAAMLWTPVLLILAILYVAFSGVFALFADILLVRTGIGGLLLLIAIPMMQVLDKLLRKQIEKTTELANRILSTSSNSS
jgi:pimeloyl-ACP methyl ester carboxylesterase